MATRSTFLAWGLGLLLMLSAGLVSAQQFEQVGNYQIHYSAVNTSFLPADVAAAYDIQRSQIQALLNISVREELEDGSTRPVNATVNGNVGNLAGQLQSLSFRTVRDDDAIYHLATFRIQEDEPMRFNLNVTYDRNQEPASINFVQRFYIDR
ncbi:hypothetical protein GCM10007160_11090 [Litchfieldella qijiaojingensis]|uniref:DUF4426 domain-containing protein n=1 Tax=Litchfieldella qijiaojingensis TaxID=980347 RepID=A0ABQ2YJX2_9GAMM|nr:DUF4426 domain-containing protein [Halomonas qijiaojingensis]GGX85461.1 hypothetical protein GCM10007160_11090 [Halomonas qijiaojingensis]